MNPTYAATELSDAIKGVITTSQDFEVYGIIQRSYHNLDDDWLGTGGGVMVSLSAAEATELAEIIKGTKQARRQEIPGQLSLF